MIFVNREVRAPFPQEPRCGFDGHDRRHWVLNRKAVLLRHPYDLPEIFGRGMGRVENVGYQEIVTAQAGIQEN
jgi:hypothetical protein